MSYDIIYNKQFVKLRRTGEVIPMILVGSNNCYEIGLGGRDGRRSRSWSNLRYYNRKGKLSEKPDYILSKLDAELRKYIRTHRNRDGERVTPTDIRNHFGYYASLVVGSGHCGGTSFGLYQSQFSNGIRNALTVEELANLGVYLHFFYHDYGDTDTSEGRPESIDLKTEREYFAELKKWREWQVKAGHMPYLSYHPHDTDRVLERLRITRRKTPKEKTSVEQDHFFVLANANGALRKYTSRGYRYSYTKRGGKRFRTEKEAETYKQLLLKKGRHQADTWQVERVNSPTTFLITI